MKLSDELMDQMAAILVKGESCDFGCSLEKVEYMKNRCHDISPGKAWSVVSSWHIWDLKCSDDEISYLKNKQGLKPTLLYSENVLEDQKQRGFGCVKTSLLKEIHHSCIFETKNTFYILVGTGTRKTITPAQANAVFF